MSGMSLGMSLGSESCSGPSCLTRRSSEAGSSVAGPSALESRFLGRGKGKSRGLHAQGYLGATFDCYPHLGTPGAQGNRYWR